MVKQIVRSLNVFGAVYAGIYIALYSSFSSQWSYLSNLYNQIKVVEATEGSNRSVIDEMKAAFIEDAIELHLSRKPMFAMIIKFWAREDAVKKLIVERMNNGAATYADLMQDIDQIV